VDRLRKNPKTPRRRRRIAEPSVIRARAGRRITREPLGTPECTLPLPRAARAPGGTSPGHPPQNRENSAMRAPNASRSSGRERGRQGASAVHIKKMVRPRNGATQMKAHETQEGCMTGLDISAEPRWISSPVVSRPAPAPICRTEAVCMGWDIINGGKTKNWLGGSGIDHHHTMRGGGASRRGGNAPPRTGPPPAPSRVSIWKFMVPKRKARVAQHAREAKEGLNAAPQEATRKKSRSLRIFTEKVTKI
jgi:hypothetical protein